jgi:hypothetical protein
MLLNSALVNLTGGLQTSRMYATIRATLADITRTFYLDSESASDSPSMFIPHIDTNSHFLNV